MPKESASNFESPERIIQLRIEQLKVAIESIKKKLSPKEMSKIDAIIVYGSTALGMAEKNSDLDIFLAFKTQNQPTPETIGTIQDIIRDTLPGIDFSCDLGQLIVRSRTTKSLDPA